MHKKFSLLVTCGLIFLAPIGLAEMDNPNEPNLCCLAEKNFAPLSEAERNLFEAISEGKVADFTDKFKDDNDPADANEWPKKRVIDANCIEWVCTDPEASKLVTHRGIWVRGARIDRELDLDFAKMLFPLRFEKCAFTKDINLRQAEVYALDLTGTHTGSIDGDRLNVAGDVRLCNGFRTDGEVRLVGATIGGYFDCTGGKFVNSRYQAGDPNNMVLEATGLEVRGNVSLRGDSNCKNSGFRAEGTVSLYGAKIGRELDCKGGAFLNPGGVAFNGDQMGVNGCVFFSEGFRAEGQVCLIGATIGRDFDCTGGKFNNELKNEKIGKNSGMRYCEALKATGIIVKGNALLRKGFQANGMVKLVGAKIGGYLECTSGKFLNNDTTAEVLEATRIEVGGNVSLCGVLRDGNLVPGSRFYADGIVSLYGGSIGGDLVCKGGEFINYEGKALCAEMLKVKGHVFLSDKFRTDGEVRLVCAIIGGHLRWVDVVEPEEATLNLQSAKIGILWDGEDDKETWPKVENLILYGLVYDEIHDKATKVVCKRKRWLQLQPAGTFRPQPYEQLAAVLKKSGYVDESKEILVEKAKARRAETTFLSGDWVWYSFLGQFIGYGYYPWKALRWILGFLVCGGILFGISYDNDPKLMIQSQDKTKQKPGFYPIFNPWMYSLDVFVPMVDLRQENYWMPDVDKGRELFKARSFTLKVGGLLRIYMWLHIIAGWVLSTLFAVGLTGLVKG